MSLASFWQRTHKPLPMQRHMIVGVYNVVDGKPVGLLHSNVRACSVEFDVKHIYRAWVEGGDNTKALTCDGCKRKLDEMRTSGVAP